MDDITKKMNTWAAAKAVAAGHTSVTPTIVTDVRFTTIYGGYCETCEYTTSGYEIAWRYPNGRYGSVEFEDDGFAAIIRGISQTEINADDWKD